MSLKKDTKLLNGAFSERDGTHITHTLTVLRLRCTEDDVDVEELFKYDLLVDRDHDDTNWQLPKVMHISERYAVSIPAGTKDSYLVFDIQAHVYRIFVGFVPRPYTFRIKHLRSTQEICFPSQQLLGVYKDKLIFAEYDRHSLLKVHVASLGTYIDDDYYPLNEKTSVTVHSLDISLPELPGPISHLHVVPIGQYVCDFAWKGEDAHQPTITLFVYLENLTNGRFRYYVTAWDIGLTRTGDLLLMKERDPIYFPTPDTRTQTVLCTPRIFSTPITSAGNLILTFIFKSCTARSFDQLTAHCKIGIKDNGDLYVVYSPELEKLDDVNICTAADPAWAQENLRSKRFEFIRFYGSVAGDYCRVNSF